MNSFYNKISIFLILLFIFLVSPLLAISIPPQPVGFVNDYADILTQTDKSSLEGKLTAFAQGTSSEIAIAIFPSLEGESLEDFSIRLAEAWKVGKKGKDNGVLLTVFVQDHKLRIEVGYGLEGVVTDLAAQRIINTVIVPQFKQNNYYQGLNLGVNAIIGLVAQDYYNTNIPAEERAMAATAGFKLPGNLPFYIGLIVLAFIISSIINKRLVLGEVVAGLFIGICFAASAGLIIAVLYILFAPSFAKYQRTLGGGSSGFFPGMMSGGFGGGGGGFGGFGGGSFGGGGSSGSW